MVAAPRRVDVFNVIGLLVEAAMAMRGFNIARARDLLNMEAGRFRALRTEKAGLASIQLTSDAAALFGLSGKQTRKLYCDLVSQAEDQPPAAGTTLADFPGIYRRLEAAIAAEIGVAKLASNLEREHIWRKLRFRPLPPLSAAELAAMNSETIFQETQAAEPSEWVAKKLRIPDGLDAVLPELADLARKLRSDLIAQSRELEHRVEAWSLEIDQMTRHLAQPPLRKPAR